MNDFNEDRLVQEPLSDYLRDDLGWESIFAFNTETFGAEGTLGRKTDREVVLTRYLSEALVRLNPGLPDDAYAAALRQITEAVGFQSITQTNRDKYLLIRDGALATYRDKGEIVKKRLRVFDYDDPENNHFLCVREMWVRGPVYLKRPDIIGFVNGLPLLFVELKRPNKDLRRAYDENLADYKDTIPHLFDFNALVILGNGIEAKVGSISAKYEHFSDWKRLAEGDTGIVQMETLIKGICTKANFLDIFENFILFDDGAGEVKKIVARNHQYLGVNRAVQSVVEREARKGKLGVFWHTQGSGKSYSMALFTQKVHRQLGGDFTFLVLTDRTDLDSQIYKTFAGVGLVNHDKDPCRAGSGAELKALLGQQKKVIFSLIQKFNEDIEDGDFYSDRDNIIVMSDEAHRSQYGNLALNMRRALPNASFIGFTGTPLFTNDEITQRVFGDYVSTYDFQRAIEDKATLPLYYDARGDKLNISSDGLNEKLAEAIEEAEIDDPDVAAKLEGQLKREYHVITAPERLEHIATDFAQHLSTNWETGKAMFVAVDKITAVKMHDRIRAAWDARIAELEVDLGSAADDQELAHREKQIAWMRETQMAVVVSNEQGEIDRFRKAGLDIIPHRKLMQDGFTDAEGKRVDVETAFKREDHPFRVVIVCAMWLTGFDVPSLSTLYLDKPLQAHTLMQAIARANRVNEGKNNGLIVDYCGILKNLRKALATFAGHTGGVAGEEGEGPAVDPLNPEEKLIGELQDAIALVRVELKDGDFDLDALHSATGFAKNKALVDAKEGINKDDETRKRFEITARAVFRKYKACLTFEGVRAFRADHDAINYIYQSLNDDRKEADTSEIMQKLNEIVGAAISIERDPASDEKVFDISKINFDLLRKEFARSEQPNSDIQDIKAAVEKRLQKMLMENPLRTDFQERFDEIVRDYNKEKDKNTIEATFEALMRLTSEMAKEEQRHVKLGLTESELPIYDMLLKPDLSKSDIRKIKSVTVELLQAIRSRMEETQDLFAKEGTRASFRQGIYDHLYDEETGLPSEGYTPEDIEDATDSIFAFYASRAANMDFAFQQ